MKNFIIIAVTIMGLEACNMQDTVTVEGEVLIKGSAPHTYVAIEDIHSKKVYKVVNQKDFNLSKKQKHILRIRGKVLNKAIGPGFPAELEILKIQ